MTIGKDFELTWLGHAAFHLKTPGGKHVLFDPWIDNPKCPDRWKSFERVDMLLLTHGHADHAGSAPDLVRKHQPEIPGMFEICLWLENEGAKNIRPMNKGGSQTVAGLEVQMVHADHSSGINGSKGVLVGGEACGFVVTLENGFRIYHAGDTNVFGDMRLIGELYAPDVACLPIGGLFTMGPREAAKAIELLGPRWVVPMHYGTFPPLTGTPDELRRHLTAGTKTEIVALEPGQTLK
ncbi:MAG: metal-dependent hydrolase [Candidatus Eiseniibacteriota bacterium]